METKAVFDIRVQPKSSRSGIVVDESDDIKVYLNSPPAEGRANKECIQLFSKKLKTAKSKISIEKGEKGRNKRISVQGMSPVEVMKMLRE